MDLDKDNVMEGTHLRIELSRIERDIKKDKVLWSHEDMNISSCNLATALHRSVEGS